MYIYIYVKNTRHLFIQKLYFGFFQTFKEVFEGLEETEVKLLNK